MRASGSPAPDRSRPASSSLPTPWIACGSRANVLCRRLEVDPPHACVAGAAAVAHGVPLRAATLAFLHAFAANLISAGIRLIPLGQTDGQRITAALAPAILTVADQALSGSLDDLGTASPLVDWCSIRHETQYTRLFRS